MTVVGRSATVFAISALVSRKETGVHLSNCSEYLRTAESPLARMSSSTRPTVSTTWGLLLWGVPASAVGVLRTTDTIGFSLQSVGIERRWKLRLHTCFQSQRSRNVFTDPPCAINGARRAQVNRSGRSRSGQPPWVGDDARHRRTDQHCAQRHHKRGVQ